MDQTIPESLKPPGQTRNYRSYDKSGQISWTTPSRGFTIETPYWIWGDLNNGKTPLICLHGGPGMSHNYLLPIALIQEDYDIPVIMYDQVGSGQSTLLPQTKGDEDFWRPQLFMFELEKLLEALNITKYHLLGQSWGGMLAAQYAIERQPRGLQKLIISNSPASMPLWSQACDALRGKLPQDIQNVLTRGEAEGNFDSEEYQQATVFFYQRHLCRVWPFPSELQAVFDAVAQDSTVYNAMNGPSEFTVIGSMRSWTIVDRLHEITEKSVPGGVLLINGHSDEAQDLVVWPFFNHITAKVKWLRFALSSHLPMLEETSAFVQGLGQFLLSG